MNDLASLNAKPRPFVVNGVTYQIHQLTLGDFGNLQAWLDAQQPDPFSIAQEQLGRFTPAQGQHILRTAMEIAAKPKPRIGTPEADLLLTSVEGTKEAFFLSIRKGDPLFDRKKLDEFFSSLGHADIAGLMQSTDLDKVITDPKATGDV